MLEINKRKAWFLLLFLFLFYLTNNYVWLNSKGSFGDGPDMISHLKTTISIYPKLLSLINPGIGESRLDNLIKILQFSQWWPPMIYINAAIFYLFFGLSNLVVQMSNIVFFLILIVSTYLIGRELKDDNNGMLAAFLISFYPVTFGLSRNFGIDFPLTAMVSLGIFFLIKTDGFTSRKYSLLFGIVSGLGILTKWAYLLFILGPLFYTLFAFPPEIENVKIKRGKIYNLLFVFLLVFSISYIWASSHWRFIFEFGWPRLTANYLPKDALSKYDNEHLMTSLINEPIGIKIFSREWFLFYIFHILNNISIFFSIVFIISSIVFVRFAGDRKKKLILIWIIFSYLFFTFCSLKVGRYYVPVLPAIAVISAFGIQEIKTNLLRKGLIIVIVLVGIFQFYRLSFDFMSRFPLRFIYIHNVVHPLFKSPSSDIIGTYAFPPRVTNFEDTAVSLGKEMIADYQGVTPMSVMIKSGYGERENIYYFLCLHYPSARIVIWNNDYNPDEAGSFDYLITIQAIDSGRPEYGLFDLCSSKGNFSNEKNIKPKNIFEKEYTRILAKHQIFPGGTHVYLVGHKS
ncbi:MAG: glycosyltransferase family 39 protein [Candidatus Omnitrophica bacterium]|nr:glycosyltransferase family 39 protein [Candidatus Omnitrophota bacterium]